MAGISNSKDLCAVQSLKLVEQPGRRAGWLQGTGEEENEALGFRWEWLDALITSEEWGYSH